MTDKTKRGDTHTILVNNWKELGISTNYGEITVKAREVCSRKKFNRIANKLIKELKKEVV